MAWAKAAARALSDRKGVTAIEYVVLSAFLCAPVIVLFNLIGGRVLDMIGRVTF